MFGTVEQAKEHPKYGEPQWRQWRSAIGAGPLKASTTGARMTSFEAARLVVGASRRLRSGRRLREVLSACGHRGRQTADATYARTELGWIACEALAAGVSLRQLQVWFHRSPSTIKKLADDFEARSAPRFVASALDAVAQEYVDRVRVALNRTPTHIYEGTIVNYPAAQTIHVEHHHTHVHEHIVHVVEEPQAERPGAPDELEARRQRRASRLRAPIEQLGGL